MIDSPPPLPPKPIRIDCYRVTLGYKRALGLVDRAFSELTDSWMHHSVDFRCSDLERHLLRRDNFKALAPEDEELLQRIDRCVRAVFHKRGLDPLLEGSEARALTEQHYLILRHDAEQLLAEGRALRTSSEESYQRWLESPAGAGPYDALSGPLSPAEFVNFFSENASTDRPEQRRYALLLLSALERQAWLLNQDGERVEPLALEMSGLRQNFFTLQQCADPGVKREALKKLISILDITPIEADSAEGLISLQTQLRGELQSEDRSREHQLLLFKAFARTIENMLVLAGAKKIGLFSEATRHGVWDDATALRDRFDKVSEDEPDGLWGRRYAYRFWADYAEQAAQHITTNVTETQRWLKRIAMLSLRAFDIAKTVAAFSNPVTAIQGISLALETIEKTVKTIQEVSYHVEWRQAWFQTSLELDRLARIFLCDPVAFDRVTQRVQALKLAKYHPSLFYSVLETLETVIVQSPVPQVKQEALKLVIQYLTVEAPLIQCRGLLILVDLVEAGGTLGKTAHVLLRLLQASRWVRSREGLSILDDYAELERIPWLRSQDNDADEMDIYLDVVKFLLVRIAEIKEEQEYGGHSLATFVSLLTSSAEDQVVPNLLQVFKEFSVQLGHEELYREPDADGNTPFHIAAQRQNLQMLSLLQRIFEPDLDAQEYRHGNSALHIASQLGYVQVIEKLLELGASPNLINHEGCAPLHLALRNQDVDAVKALLKGDADVDRMAHDGRSALNIAIEQDHVALVRLLLKHNAHIAEHVHECTPIVKAARGAQVEVLQFLIQRKIDAGEVVTRQEAFRILGYICADGRNVTCPEAFARFHLDLIEQHPEYAEIFEEFRGHLPRPIMEGERLRIERPPLDANRFGNSPLLEAATSPDRMEHLIELLGSGADDTPNYLGVTAMHAAAATGNVEALRRLIEHAVPLNPETELGFTPLMLAAYYRNAEVLGLLLEAGADLEVRSDYGDTALLVAAGHARERGPEVFASLPRGAYIRSANDEPPALIDRLLAAGASTAAVDRLGNNALHRVVAYGSPAAIRSLCDANDSLFWMKDIRGYTPLAAAIKLERSEVVPELLEAQSQGDLKRLHSEVLEHSEERWSLAHLLAAAGLRDSFEALVECVPEAIELSSTSANRELPIHSASAAGRLSILQLYVEREWPLDVRDRFGNNALHLATLNGHSSSIRLLLDHCTPDCRRNHDLRVPLHFAASEDRPEILEPFLGDVKSVLRRDGHGDLPLHIACRYGHPENVRRLLEVYPESINWRNDDGETPLYIAAARGHLGVARVLHTFEANAELANLTGMTPLIAAAQEGNQELVDFLVDEVRVNLKAADDEGETALHKAVFRLHVDCVRKLLSVDSPLLYPRRDRLIHARDFREGTPLHELAKPKLGFREEDAIEILYLLLRGGASIVAPDEAGNNFVHRLCFYGQWRLLTETEYYMRSVRQVGIDVTRRNKQGDTYLHQAVRGGVKPMVRACMEAQLVWPDGVDVNAQNNEGMTAPMLAAQAGMWELLNYFACSNGVNWLKVDNDGWSILHWLLSNAELGEEGLHCLKLLLENKPKLALIQSQDKQTPLHLAAEHGHSEAFKLLMHAAWLRGENLQAYLRARDESGQNAELLARNHGHHRLAALIQRYRAPEEPQPAKCLLQ